MGRALYLRELTTFVITVNKEVKDQSVLFTNLTTNVMFVDDSAKIIYEIMQC